MPIVHVHLRAGRSAAEKKAILDAVHAAFVEAFQIPESDRNQLLHEHAPEHLESRHGAASTLIEATVFPGRSVEAKRTLYAALARNLERAAGIPPAAVLTVLHAPPLEDWGVRGGKPASEVDLAFKVDV